MFEYVNRRIKYRDLLRVDIFGLELEATIRRVSFQGQFSKLIGACTKGAYKNRHTKNSWSKGLSGAA